MSLLVQVPFSCPLHVNLVTKNSLSHTQLLFSFPTCADATGNDAVAQTDFGRLGISLFILTWMCIGWTVWLVSLSVNPSGAVAQIMRTEDFDHDDGAYGDASLSVWEIVDPNASAQVLGVVGFSLILLGYVFVALKLTVWQQLSRVWSPPEPAGKDSQKSLDKVVAVMAQRPETQVSESFATVRRRSISRSSSRVMKELAQVETSLLKNKVRSWICREREYRFALSLLTSFLLPNVRRTCG